MSVYKTYQVHYRFEWIAKPGLRSPYVFNPIDPFLSCHFCQADSWRWNPALQRWSWQCCWSREPKKLWEVAGNVAWLIFFGCHCWTIFFARRFPKWWKLCRWGMEICWNMVLFNFVHFLFKDHWSQQWSRWVYIQCTLLCRARLQSRQERRPKLAASRSYQKIHVSPKREVDALLMLSCIWIYSMNLAVPKRFGACSTVPKWNKNSEVPKPVTEPLGRNPNIIKNLQTTSTNARESI